MPELEASCYLLLSDQSSMDAFTKKRFDGIDARISKLETGLAELKTGLTEEITELRDEVTDGFRQLDLRLSTEVREVAGMLRDLKAWLVDRDETKARLDKLEEEFSELKRQRQGV